MKKTFVLTHPKLNLARLIESYKNEAKKYMKREQRKTLPEGYDYWGFDCKYGATEAEAAEIHVGEINKCLSAAEAAELPSFYLEILAKPMQRVKLEPRAAEDMSDEDEPLDSE